MSVLVRVKTELHNCASLLHLQSRLWPISGEVRQLPCIHRTTSLLANHVDSIFILQSKLNQCQSHHHRRTSQSSDTVHSYAGARLLGEPLSQQFKETLNNIRWRRSAIIKRQVQDSDAILLQLFRCVRRLTDSHYVKHLMPLQLLDVPSHVAIRRPVSDKESSALVINRSWLGSPHRHLAPSARDCIQLIA